MYYPKALKFLEHVAIHDWKIIAISHLNPLIPASAMGYAFGLSKINFTRYLFFSMIFMLPLQILFVITGSYLMSLFKSELQSLIIWILSFFSFGLILSHKYIYRVLCRLLGVKNET